MKLAATWSVGVDTHTGRVRTANEDDYLVLAPATAAGEPTRLLLVVADGMGGVTGGAEASRAAVRALSAAFLSGTVDGDARARLEEGFARACAHVAEMSREHPRLRDMGTTLTALHLTGDRAVLGHVGDSRCYRWRRGEAAEALTVDHAVRGVEHRLTRCVGGGRDTEEVDVHEFEVRPGDTFLLATDGLWDQVSEAEIGDALAQRDVQTGAEALVRAALARGGPDNCTALIVRAHAPSDAGGRVRPVDLPPRETPRALSLDGPLPDLRAPRWPWAVLVLALAIAGAAAARLLAGWSPFA